MTAHVEFNSAASADDAAPVGEKLIAAVAPEFNKLVDMAAQYAAVTDIDSAVGDWKATDPEDVKKAEAVEKARKLIEKYEAELAEKARAEVLASIAPDFDEAKFAAKFNDDRKTVVEWLNSTRNTFDMIGFLKSEVSDKGRRGNWTGVTPDGEKLVYMLANLPKLDSKSSNSSEDTPEKEAARNERKAAKTWAREQGKEVADKGALSRDILDAFRAAGSPGYEGPQAA